MQRGWGTLLGRNWYICNSACDPRKQMVLISTFEEQGVESEKPQSLAQSGLCWILCCNMCKCLSKNMLWGTRISSYLRAWVIPTPSLRLHLGFTQCLSEPNGLSGTSLFNSYPLSLSLSQSKHHQSNKKSHLILLTGKLVHWLSRFNLASPSREPLRILPSTQCPLLLFIDSFLSLKLFTASSWAPG